MSWDPFWAISDDTLRILMARLIETRGTVLECGSGRSTLCIAKMLQGERRHVAMEQAPFFWAQTLEALCEHDVSCELSLGTLADGFYPLPELREGEVGLLFVDGPDNGGDRSKAMPTLDRYLAPDAVVVVDDADRDDWWRTVPGWTATYHKTVRGCAVLTRKSCP